MGTFIKMVDAPNTYNYTIDKLINWGYKISVVNDMADFVDKFIWVAEKDEKQFSATDPLRLLELVTIIQEYGETWDCIEVASSFSIKPIKSDLF